MRGIRSAEAVRVGILGKLLVERGEIVRWHHYVAVEKHQPLAACARYAVVARYRAPLVLVLYVRQVKTLAVIAYGVGAGERRAVLHYYYLEQIASALGAQAVEQVGYLIVAVVHRHDHRVARRVLRVCLHQLMRDL